MTLSSDPRQRELALFPLSTVLFPGGPLPLRIFEPRYLDMVSRCMREDTGFGVIAITSGAETGPVETAGVGTLARITDWYQLSGGLLGITATGRRRFQILSREQQKDGLLVAQVEWLPDTHGIPLPPRHAPLAQVLRSVIEQVGGPYRNLDERYDDAAWVSGRLAEILPVDNADKQAWLEIDDPLERLDEMLPALSSLREQS